MVKYSKRKNSRKQRTWFGFSDKQVVAAVVAIAGLMGWNVYDYLPKQASPSMEVSSSNSFVCNDLKVTDGDTLRCGERRVRLAGIDAPELPGHCRKGRECTPGDPYASTDNLKKLVNAGTLVCTQQDVDHYGRTIARCEAAGVDVSCQQIKDGHAVQRYGKLDC